MEFSKRQRKENQRRLEDLVQKKSSDKGERRGEAEKKKGKKGSASAEKKEASVSMMVWFRCTPWSGAALGSGRLSWYGKVKLETLVHTTSTTSKYCTWAVIQQTCCASQMGRHGNVSSNRPERPLPALPFTTIFSFPLPTLSLCAAFASWEAPFFCPSRPARMERGLVRKKSGIRSTPSLRAAWFVGAD